MSPGRRVGRTGPSRRGPGRTAARHRLRRVVPLLLPALAVVACGDDGVAPPTPPPDGIFTPGVRSYGYEVLATYPHDPGAFTQGLVLEGARLFESTGLRGRSSLREVSLESGEVLRRVDLAPEFFGEGLTLYDGRAIQLTWTSRRGFVYDADTFARERTFDYESEGWGLTHDGSRLIMSDGTATLQFRNPDTFELVGATVVRDLEGTPVPRLNELEYVEGRILANVWLTDRVAVIDPQTGRVEAWIDLAGLLPPEDAAGADVLNGIAVDAERGELLVTGKLWPTLYRIRLVPGG